MRDVAEIARGASQAPRDFSEPLAGPPPLTHPNVAAAVPPTPVAPAPPPYGTSPSLQVDLDAEEQSWSPHSSADPAVFARSARPVPDKISPATHLDRAETDRVTTFAADDGAQHSGGSPLLAHPNERDVAPAPALAPLPSRIGARETLRSSARPVASSRLPLELDQGPLVAASNAEISAIPVRPSAESVVPDAGEAPSRAEPASTLATETAARAKDDPSLPDPIRSATFADHAAFESPAIAWGDVLDAAEVRDTAARRIPQTAPAPAAAPPPRTVRIAIDRIELVAPPQPPAPPRRAEPTMTLDRYAERRR